MARVLAALVIGLVWLCARPAHASWHPHHDLTSLVFASDEVVLGKRVGADADAGGDAFQVEKVYRGRLEVGQTFSARIYAVFEPEESPARVSDRMVLFLKRDKDGGLGLVDSGLRVLVDDRVQRFVVGGRFGDRYVRTPQGRDPGEAGVRVGAGVDFATFEADLERAVKRAARARELFDDARGNAREIVLLIAPPSEDQAIVVSRQELAFADLVAEAGLDQLAKAGAVEELVEAHERSLTWLGLRLDRVVAIEPLLAIARDAARPPGRRAAAVRALDAHARGSNKERLAAFTELLASDEAEVRLAATERLLRDLDRDDALRRAVVAQYQREPDERVRFSIVEFLDLMSSLGEVKKTHVPEVLVHIQRRGRLVEIAWTSLKGERWEPDGVDITLRHPDGASVARHVAPEAFLSQTGSSKDGRVELLVSPEDLREPGLHPVDVGIVLRKGAERASRRLALPPLRIVGQALPAASAVPSSSAPAASATAPEPGAAKGCGCEAAGSAPPSGRAVAGLLLAAFVTGRARRRRRAGQRAAHW